MHTRVLKSSQIRTGFFLLPSMNKKKTNIYNKFIKITSCIQNYFILVNAIFRILVSLPCRNIYRNPKYSEQVLVSTKLCIIALVPSHNQEMREIKTNHFEFCTRLRQQSMALFKIEEKTCF